MPKFLLTLLLIFATSFSWSQDSQQEKLEKRKAEIQREIREKRKCLKSKKRRKNSF